ncbi:MAG: translation initiation factor IF-2 N-terminal domain-containing protein, partial [Proteobacteria bacterium]|nr:translation initiation factor IF-2 N-terminal domain-containing protein [Pseudomonadota bacterium]
MSDVTVKQLASVLGISSDKLMEQLDSAGIKAQSEDDSISNESKVKLLEFLRGSHGKSKKSLSPRKKIVLKRKSTEVLKVSSGTGGVKSKTKSINIEVKKKKSNLGPSQREMDEIEKDRQAAQEALDLRKVQLEAEAQTIKEAEEQQEVARQEELKQTEELKAQQEKAQQEKNVLEQQDTEQAGQVVETDEPQTQSTDTKTAEPVVETEEQIKKRKHDELVEKQVQQAVTERANRKKQKEQGNQNQVAKKPTPSSEKPAGTHKKGRQNTRYGRKQLHMQGKPKGGKKPSFQSNKPVEHGFQKPLEPVVKTVEIPEHISVADLAKEMAIKSTDIIKVLMKMGMMVTINQSLD